jgi:F420-non-reducing hydrogenase iron-sulfur subunit
MSTAQGARFAEVTSGFVKKVRELGPLGKGEGMDEDGLKLKLDSATKLIPYIKLVERERLRVPTRSEEAYNEFYKSDELNRLLCELVLDKLAISQITSLLRKRPRSTSEIAEILGLGPSEVSKYLTSSSRQGLVRYDESQRCYALA